MRNQESAPGELLGRELSEAVVMFHEGVARKLGMTAAEWKCLDLLGRNGPFTAKRLAEVSGLTTGAITGIVDRLEKAGYVQRTDNPTDRRSVIIKALPRQDLVKTLTPIFTAHGQAMGELALHYDERERAVIQDFYQKTVVILKEQAAKLNPRQASGGAE